MFVVVAIFSRLSLPFVLFSHLHHHSNKGKSVFRQSNPFSLSPSTKSVPLPVSPLPACPPVAPGGTSRRPMSIPSYCNPKGQRPCPPQQFRTPTRTPTTFLPPIRARSGSLNRRASLFHLSRWTSLRWENPPNHRSRQHQEVPTRFPLKRSKR